MIAVTAYTPGYQDLALRLLATCDRHGQDVHALPYPSRGTWERNGHVKPEAIRWAAAYAPGRDVLWLDADAELVAPWTWALPAGADLAAHVLRRSPRHRPELLSGTVLVAADSVVRVCDAWQTECAGGGDAWDQKLLAQAVDRAGLVLAELPPECCWIPDTSPGVYGDRAPVVVHGQASRAVRKGERGL